MPKIDIETLKFILQRNEPDITKVSTILQDVEMELKAEEEERSNRPPNVKKQFCILISDPEGWLRDRPFTGWVVQIPEDDSPAVIQDRINKTAYEFNTTPKGRRIPVATVGETLEVVPSKFFKEQNLWVKTKCPVLVNHTNNKIPRDNSDE